MSRFTGESVERVKEAADVVEVLSAYTELRRTGTRFTALCPFHDERSPSFSVDPQAKLYHCFGCGVGGDVIKFVEEKEGLSFPDAVEALAERYGVELDREQEDPRAEEQRRKRGRLVELLERTAAFYTHFLWDAPQARKARDYLASRGLGEEALGEFGVGCAPGTWDTVLVRGQQAGYSVAEIEAAGLVLKSQKGRGHYDRFRSRIVFPIRDARGRMQGFGARALTADQKPKYVNSPEGELYSKRRTLYGIERARPAIAKAERAVVVEGYTDVIACHQAGITESVAIMGTAITPEQVRLLAAYAEQAVLALDADRAGREAMLRAQVVAQGKRLRLRVARMSPGEDPADLLAGPAELAGREKFTKALEGSEDLMMFHARSVLEDGDLATPDGRDQVLAELGPIIKSMGDSVEATELRRMLVDRLDTSPQIIARRTGVAPASSDDVSQDEERRMLYSQRERREQALLAMCVRSPADGRDFLERLRPEHFSAPVAARARGWLIDHLEEPTQGLPREDEELVSYITEITMRAEREPAGREAMELSLLELDLGQVDDEIASAETDGGDPPVELQKRRAELTERIARAGG